jgi:hypothetical protein
MGCIYTQKTSPFSIFIKHLYTNIKPLNFLRTKGAHEIVVEIQLEVDKH